MLVEGADELYWCSQQTLNNYLCSLKEQTNCKVRKNKCHGHIGLGMGRIVTDERNVESIFEGLRQ